MRSYAGVTEAEVENNITGISNVCNPTSICKSRGGFMWKYDNGDHSDIDAYHANGRIVEQVNPKTQTIISRFESLAEASRITGINSQNICAVCAGRRKTTGGFEWRYSY